MKPGADVGPKGLSDYAEKVIISLVTRRDYSWRYPHEDIIQEMRIAYWRASRDWKPDHGASLHTYCMRRAKGRIQQFMRDTGFLIHVPSYAMSRGFERIDPIFYNSLDSPDDSNEFAGRDFAPFLIEVLSEQ